MDRMTRYLVDLENPVILSLTNQTFHDLKAFFEG